MADSRPVDFLCIGAEKSGTTWLADMLRQHPDVFIPTIKEVHYFNARQVAYPELGNPNLGRPIDWYHSYFRHARPHQLKGECSVGYLACPTAADRIASYNPAMRVLILLRDPVDRLFSQFRAYRARGILARLDLQQALQQRPDLIERSRYATHLNRYLARFPTSQIHVMIYDDIMRQPSRLMADLYGFLGLETFAPKQIERRSNATTEPRSVLLSRFLEGIYRTVQRIAHPRLLDLTAVLGISGAFGLVRRFNSSSDKPVVDQLSLAQRTQLFELFERDIDELEGLLHRDLSAWRPQ